MTFTTSRGPRHHPTAELILGTNRTHLGGSALPTRRTATMPGSYQDHLVWSSFPPPGKHLHTAFPEVSRHVLGYGTTAADRGRSAHSAGLTTTPDDPTCSLAQPPAAPGPASKLATRSSCELFNGAGRVAWTSPTKQRGNAAATYSAQVIEVAGELLPRDLRVCRTAGARFASGLVIEISRLRPAHPRVTCAAPGAYAGRGPRGPPCGDRLHRRRRCFAFWCASGSRINAALMLMGTALGGLLAALVFWVSLTYVM